MAISIISPDTKLEELLSSHNEFQPKTFDDISKAPKDSLIIIDKSDKIEDESGNVILKKPYHISGLIHFLKSSAKNTKELPSLKGYNFNYNQKTLQNDDETIILTEKEAEIIEVLLQASPDAIDKNELLEKALGYKNSIDTQTLGTHIYRLRKKLEPLGDIIVTEKDGYKIIQ